MANWEAAPAATVMVVETTSVNGPSVNVKVYGPTGVSSARPENVATPATATAVLCAIVPLPDVSVAVTVVVSVGITVPLESSTSTTGWIVSAAPAAAVADGCVTMTSFEAIAVGAVVVADDSEPSVKMML